MENATKPKLTLFARLWPLSVVLFLALCVAVCYAVINERTNLIGLSSVGLCLMFFVQLSQLISAIVVRKWWCLIGCIMGLVLSTFFLVCTIVALAAGQYRPPVWSDEALSDSTEVDDESAEPDFSFEVVPAGQKAAFTDIVTAILNQEETGDEYAEMRKTWEKFRKGQPLPKGKSIQMDAQNNHLIYMDSWVEEGGSDKSSHQIELCCWDCSDGIHRLVAENTVDIRGGEPVCGQFSGLTFYLYDSETGRMEFEYASDLKADFEIPEDTHLLVYKLLPSEGAVECKCYARGGLVTRRLTWNGEKFSAK